MIEDTLKELAACELHTPGPLEVQDYGEHHVALYAPEINNGNGCNIVMMQPSNYSRIEAVRDAKRLAALWNNADELIDIAQNRFSSFQEYFAPCKAESVRVHAENEVLCKKNTALHAENKNLRQLYNNETAKLRGQREDLRKENEMLKHAMDERALEKLPWAT